MSVFSFSFYHDSRVYRRNMKMVFQKRFNWGMWSILIDICFFFFVSWGLLGKLNVQAASVKDSISKTQVYELESDYGAFAFKPNCLSRSKMNRRPEPIYLLHFSNANNLWARCNLKFIRCTLLPTVRSFRFTMLSQIAHIPHKSVYANSIVINELTKIS